MSIENLIGTAGNDTLTGDAGNNIIEGGAGADTMDGGAGIDTLSYARSANGVVVNLATKSASGGDAAGDTFKNFENLTGSAHADRLTGDDGANIIDGGIGNDILDGGAGDDALYGGAGNDTLIGGAGADALFGGGGSDTASYRTSTAGVKASLVLADAAFNTGDAFGDTYHDSIANLEGSNSDDTLVGDERANILNGIGGNDILIGGAGADTLIGGTGPGIDTASYETAAARVVANLANSMSNTGDAAGDTYSSIENLTGSAFDDTLSGGDGVNTLNGGAGNDTLNGNGNDILVGGAGADSLNGGGGDTASYATSTKGVTVSLLTPSSNSIGTDAEGDTYHGIENVTGSAFADTLTGDTQDNVLNGGAGDDTLNGGDGNDTLLGGEGNDTLDGGVGNDVLDGGVGADDLKGGDGIDTVSYANANNLITANLATGVGTAGDATGDRYTGIENLTGGSHADQLTGNDNDNVLDGGIGNDTLKGGAGNDTLIGGAGDDNLFGGIGADTLEGGAGSDTASYLTEVTASLADATVNTGEAAGDIYRNIENLAGSNFNDTLTGDEKANILNGNNGNDRLEGGAGNDTLIGGTGNDTFVFGAGSGQDTITDFKSGDALEFRDGLFADAGAVLAAAKQNGPDVIIPVDADNSIVLKNVSLGSLRANDIKIVSDNQAPIAVTDHRTVNEDATLVFSAAELKDNDTDANGDSLTVTEVKNATHGTVELDINGNVIFKADANYSGIAKFDYTVIDGHGGTSTGTVTVDVVPVADAPHLSTTATITSNEGAPVSLGISASPGNLSEHLKLTVSGVPAGAILTDGIHTFAPTADGTIGDLSGWTLSQLIMRPPANFIGDLPLTFTATSTDSAQMSDGTVLSDTASVPSQTTHVNVIVADQVLNGTDGDDLLIGGHGNDTLRGNAGNDTLIGGEGNDTFEGGAGKDTVSYETSIDGVHASLGLHVGSGGDAEGDHYNTDIENLKGSIHNDTLDGDNGDNILDGGDGDDHLNSGNGADILIGGKGANSLGGGSDPHTTVSYITAEAIVHDLGDGKVELLGVTADFDNPNRNTSDAFGDSYSHVQNLTGSHFNDRLTAGQDDSVVNGLEGDDVLDGGGPLSGITGNDTLIGGAGHDTFVFRSGSGQQNHDTIVDFEVGETVELHDGFTAAQALDHAVQQANGDIVITFNANDTLTLKNFALANLHLDNFHVV